MKHLLITNLLLFSVSVMAEKPSPTVLKAIYNAATRHKLNAQDLIGIAYLESNFNIHATRNNQNGTVDYGLFQINSVHWTTTCKNLDVFTLLGNIECAAILLVHAKAHAETDEYWQGRYHSKTPSLKIKYYKKLKNIAQINLKNKG